MDTKGRVTESDIANQPSILDRKFATPNEWAEHYAMEFDRWLILESRHHHFRDFTMTVAFVCAMLQRAIDRQHTQ